MEGQPTNQVPGQLPPGPEQTMQAPPSMPQPEQQATAQPAPRSRDDSNLPMIVVIAAIALFSVSIVFLIIAGANQRGTANNPYNMSLGFQGSGYYNVSGRSTFISNQTQLNAIPSTTSTTINTTTVNTTTAPTTSQSTSVPTTTIQKSNASSSTTTVSASNSTTVPAGNQSH